MQEKPLKTWFHEARHIEKISGDPQEKEDQGEWRKIKERMKTVSVALVLCLNVGTDPPDTVKPVPCARREAWVDPSLMNIQKVPQQVATHLQKSYERLQPRARYKAAIDPTIDYVKRLCISLRKSAGKERVLFHFNGHGVPRPTEAGEIWVFNKNITQYIPVSIFDLQSWMGTPSVYVWDCHSAGTIVKNFKKFAMDHSVSWLKEVADRNSEFYNKDIKDVPNFNECIQLAACDENELLPTDPDLPADLFTSCLTTPIQTSMLWYVLKTNTKDRYPLQMIDSIPGTLTERRSVLGELNWIFTAITDTIAWNRLPKDTFQKLFRQDLLVASLFRSFLLAEKIMRDNGCRVVSNPALPPVYDHPLWEYWEYTIELCLINMYNQKHKPPASIHFSHNDCFLQTHLKHSLLIELPPHMPAFYEDFSYNWFFIEQLKAFEVWLRFDASREQAPDQLPVVLQVLLSQVHRVQALELLARFVDIGSWAVLEALFVGVFPYVLKLLQSGTKELRNSLAFIWAKILIVDPKCCEDLMNDEGYMYFVDILKDQQVQPRYKIVPAFVIATLMNHQGRVAQEKFFWADLIEITMDHLTEQQDVKNCKMLCVWLLIGLGKLWNNFDKARWQAVRITAYADIVTYLSEDVPEVRAAAMYALGQLMRNRSLNNEHATNINNYICDSLTHSCGWDGSVLVRLELVVAIQWFIIDYRSKFAETCLELDKRVFFNHQRTSESSSINGSGSVANFASPIPSSNAPGRRTISTSSWNSDNGTTNGSLNASSLCVEPSMTGRLYSRENIYQQWQLLEKKSLLSPFERIWVIALRLSFDPMSHVRDLAKKIVLYVVTEAEGIRKRIDEANSVVAESPKVMFEVGSPMNPEILNALPRNNSLQQRLRNSSSGGDGSRTIDRIPTYNGSSMFTPKRKIHDMVRNESQPHVDVKDTDILEPIITTEFVEWSGKIFNKRIYRTLYDEEQSSARDWMVDGVTRFTCLIPTDWALHTAEGVEQHAGSDVLAIQKTKGNQDPNAFTFAYHRTIHCIEWSYLRPFVYICDGRKVEGFNTMKLDRTKPPESAINIVVNDDPLFEDPLTDIIVINEKNHEILLCGTQDGLISIWDPIFDEHSHEKKGDAKMLTSNFIFNDQPRVFNNNSLQNNNRRFNKYNHQNQSNTTFYRWDQNNGRLLCGGNVKIARIWDAWAEKNKIDINLDQKDGITSSLCADFNQELVCTGFNYGASAVYDIRISGKYSKIMAFRSETRSKVVGCSFLKDTSTLVIGHEDAIVKVYDPRKFAEPLEVFKADESRIEMPRPTSASFMSFGGGGTNNNFVKRANFPITMTKMNVQASNSIVACALNDSTIRLFDLDEKKHRSLDYLLHPQAPQPFLDSKISTMRFHSRRVHLAVSTDKNIVGVYNVN